MLSTIFMWIFVYPLAFLLFIFVGLPTLLLFLFILCMSLLLIVGLISTIFETEIPAKDKEDI